MYRSYIRVSLKLTRTKYSCISVTLIIERDRIFDEEYAFTNRNDKSKRERKIGKTIREDGIIKTLE